MATSRSYNGERITHRLIQHPVTRWVFLFLALNLFLEQVTGNNGRSRYALLQAMSQRGTFTIDGFEKQTTDWANTPDGHYYSNKAPGPAFVAYPLFFVFDRFFHGERFKNLFLRLASFLFQLIPFAILAYFLFSPTNTLALAAYFFGTTLSMLLNTYFGHGVAAVFLLAMVVALKKERAHAAGFCFGWALLSEYSIGLLLLPTVAWIVTWKSPKKLLLFLAGGIIPGALWAWYHYTCFGGILTLPNQFQNPEYVEAGSQYAVWGIFSFLPSPETLIELLFGSERGILFTQPWIFLVPFLVAKRDAWFWFCVVSFLLLLWLNASFNGWHGGNAPGPRYLSPILPFFAILIPATLSAEKKKALWLFLAPSFLLYVLLMGTFIEAPHGKALWGFAWEAWRDSSKATPYVRLFVILTGIRFFLIRRPLSLRLYT